jgi:S-formylglutathione hydrolase FrmB
MPHYADSFSVILVCPDGSYNAWYLNSPIDKRSQYDTYFFRDVIPYIDKHYRTIPSGDARAIIGTSMGGHGALTMLARHPEMFFGAGSISGILDLTQFPREWDIARILGPYENNKLRWEQHSFVYMADSLQNKNKHISIDCGTNDFALPVNRAAHSKLVALNIPHEYLERPGSHSLAYMRQVLGYHIGSLMESIKR